MQYNRKYEAVKHMIDEAAENDVKQFFYTVIGNVDIDDSDGGTGLLANQIYQLWLELLRMVGGQEKAEMYQWYTSYLDGSAIDYLEEYIEQIIMEEFQEEDYVDKKLLFVAGKKGRVLKSAVGIST